MVNATGNDVFVMLVARDCHGVIWTVKKISGYSIGCCLCIIFDYGSCEMFWEPFIFIFAKQAVSKYKKCNEPRVYIRALSSTRNTCRRMGTERRKNIFLQEKCDVQPVKSSERETPVYFTFKLPSLNVSELFSEKGWKLRQSTWELIYWLMVKKVTQRLCENRQSFQGSTEILQLSGRGLAVWGGFVPPHQHHPWWENAFRKPKCSAGIYEMICCSTFDLL